MYLNKFGMKIVWKIIIVQNYLVIIVQNYLVLVNSFPWHALGTSNKQAERTACAQLMKIGKADSYQNTVPS